MHKTTSGRHLVLQTTAEPFIGEVRTGLYTLLHNNPLVRSVKQSKPDGCIWKVQIFRFLHKNDYCKKKTSVSLPRTRWSLKTRMLLYKLKVNCRTQDAHGAL